jgi:hypothetical protein
MPIIDDSIEMPGADFQSASANRYWHRARSVIGPVFVLLIAAALYQIRYGTRPCKSIRWEKFSLERRDASLAAGKAVLVFVFAEPAPVSDATWRDFDCHEAKRICNGKDFVPMMLRHHWESQEIRSVWRDVGHTKYSMIVVYSPDKSPTVYQQFRL